MTPYQHREEVYNYSSLPSGGIGAARGGGGIVINFFGDVVGLDEEEISRRLSDELGGKISL